MINSYKLDKSFGPTGSITGIILFVAGVILVWFSWSALMTILLGAFLGFTYSRTEIDFDRKKVRHSDVLFGVIKTGKWMNVRPEMKIGIIKSRKTWRTYSASNRQLDIPSEDYRLVLFKASGKKIMPIKKVAGLNAAKEDIETICRQLEINKL